MRSLKQRARNAHDQNEQTLPDMLTDEDPLGQVKFVRLFKVTVLNLHEIHRMDKRKSFVFPRQF